MQWVVTTGRTVAEARDRALDALGIDEDDLELEVLDEPGSRLLGLRRTDARVRARVRPTRPRPKLDRRTRRRTGRRRDEDDAAREELDRPAPKAASGRNRRRRGGGGRDGAAPSDAGATAAGATEEPGNLAEPPATGIPDTEPTTAPTPEIEPTSEPAPTGPTGASMSDITIEEQQPTAVSFVTGLLEAFGADGAVASEQVDDETVEITVTGEDLGLLVGPRGTTLHAIQELTRTAIAQQHNGRLEGRIRVDVAGYRAKRKEALTRFALQQAERVKETGSAVALEPMSPPDRKIVHDAINELDGVRTSSEGEDRRRHVVIHPA